jgi:hypothetical protein
MVDNYGPNPQLNLKGQTLDEIFDVFEICPFSGTMFCDSQ